MPESQAATSQRIDVRPHANASAYAIPARDTRIIPDVGALAQWQAEVREGARTMVMLDPLTRAACAEANARDAMRLGLLSTANNYRQQAAQIILDAAASRGVA